MLTCFPFLGTISKKTKKNKQTFLKRQTVCKSNEKEKDVEQVQNATPKAAEIMEAQTCSILKQFLMRKNSMPRFCGV